MAIRFHHVNLAVPPQLEQAEEAFLVDVLGYRKLDPPAAFADRALWYGADDGSQVHLSVDPSHQPAAMAHTAVEVDQGIEARLSDAGCDYRTNEGRSLRVFLCRDPAGNRWELRARAPRPSGDPESESTSLD